MEPKVRATSSRGDSIVDSCRSAHAHGRHCFRLMDGNSVIATGFIIQQSKKTVPIWENGKVKLLPVTNRPLEYVDQFISASR